MEDEKGRRSADGSVDLKEITGLLARSTVEVDQKEAVIDLIDSACKSPYGEYATYYPILELLRPPAGIGGLSRMSSPTSHIRGFILESSVSPAPQTFELAKDRD